MKVQDIVQLAGSDNAGRKVIMFQVSKFTSLNKPEKKESLEYFWFTLKFYSKLEYTLVCYASGIPSLKRIWKSYAEFLRRKYKGNLKALYIVNLSGLKGPVLRTAIRSEFRDRVMFLDNENELTKLIGENGQKISKKLNAKNVSLFQIYQQQPATRGSDKKTLKSQHFGVGLDYIKRNNGGDVIPPVVRQCVEYIRGHGLKTVGIFRLSSAASEIQRAQEMFDYGTKVDFASLGSDPVFIAANILKKFLRELPEPILTYKICNRIKEITCENVDFSSLGDCDNMDPIAISTPKKFLRDLPEPILTPESCNRIKEMNCLSFTEDEKIKQLKLIILKELPDDNYFVLKYIIKLLTEVISFASYNKMDLTNLVIVISPNLLRSKETTGLDMTSLNYGVWCTRSLIAKYEEIFSK